MHGEPPSDDLQNGPVDANRGCTDILVLIIYILAIGAMVYVSIQGYANGHP